MFLINITHIVDDSLTDCLNKIYKGYYYKSFIHTFFSYISYFIIKQNMYLKRSEKQKV